VVKSHAYVRLGAAAAAQSCLCAACAFRLLGGQDRGLAWVEQRLHQHPFPASSPDPNHLALVQHRACSTAPAAQHSTAQHSTAQRRPGGVGLRSQSKAAAQAAGAAGRPAGRQAGRQAGGQAAGHSCASLRVTCRLTLHQLFLMGPSERAQVRPCGAIGRPVTPLFWREAPPPGTHAVQALQGAGGQG
jgi:hypothetical protein